MVARCVKICVLIVTSLILGQISSKQKYAPREGVPGRKALPRPLAVSECMLTQKGPGPQNVPIHAKDCSKGRLIDLHGCMHH
jgi:hypothetical protein